MSTHQTATLTAACARYAQLVIRQLDALGSDDTDEYHRLADERDEIARRIQELKPDAPDMDEAAAELARASTADRMLLDRLSIMRAAARASLDRIAQRRNGILAYGSARSGAASVDVLL